MGQVRWDVRQSGPSLARPPEQGQRPRGEGRCRERHRDMVADGVGSKEGEGCKRPLGCLAWSHWMVTLFTELEEAYKKQVWEDREN